MLIKLPRSGDIQSSEITSETVFHQRRKMIKAMGLLPVISKTEREALDAGTVWYEGELFSGKPDFKRLIKEEKYPELTDEERLFLEGPAEDICAMTDDWLVYQKRDLAPDVWSYLRNEGFFGMIISKEYGGLEFSATAISAVIKKTHDTKLRRLKITMVVQ